MKTPCTKRAGFSPRIIASNYPYCAAFPITVGWAEKQHFGDLPVFAKAEGSDTEQFENFDEAAQRLYRTWRDDQGSRRSQTSRWFARTADAVNAEIAEAQKAIGDHPSKEFNSTIVDLKILRQSRSLPRPPLTRRRQLSALCVVTKDPNALDDAMHRLSEMRRSKHGNKSSTPPAMFTQMI